MKVTRRKLKKALAMLKYLDSRTADLDKYLERSGKVQQRLLKKLKGKETKIRPALAGQQMGDITYNIDAYNFLCHQEDFNALDIKIWNINAIN